jgi:ABC-type lipoprotein export system ATPase subunit
MAVAEVQLASLKVETRTSLAVCCAKVTKTFGTGAAAVRALRGVDLEMRTGELMMLVGPSGSGKTTLISVIAGVLSRDGGDCSVVITPGCLSMKQRVFAVKTSGLSFRLGI